MGRKKMFETKAETDEYKKKWFSEYKQNLSKEKKAEYNRTAALKRCMERKSVPTLSTINLYNFTKAEIQPIFDSLFIEEQLTDVSDTTDTIDSE